MTSPAISPCFFISSRKRLAVPCRETVAVFFRQRKWRPAKSNPLNRADAPTITGITKTLFIAVATTVSSNARVNRLPAFWHKYKLIDIRPSFTVKYDTNRLGLCRRTKLKNLLVSASSFSFTLPSRFRPWIFCFYLLMSLYLVYEFSATQSCAEPFPHSVFFRYAKNA